MLEPNDPRVRWATFGKQVEEFFQSDIGDYLLKKSEEEISTAVQKLKSVSPWRRRKIQQIQNDIRVAEMFQQWLANAITTGHTALEDLKEEHE